MKKRSATFYRKKCVNHAKKEAKERDNYICQHCGKPVKGYEAHGSHILPEGAYPLMSAEKDNILCLCYHCHFHWWHKHPLEASAWFNEKWPGRYKQLMALDKEKSKRLTNWQKRWEEIKISTSPFDSPYA